MNHKWFIFPAAGLLALVVGFLLWGNLNSNLVYYLAPVEAVDQRSDFPDGERFRLGGLVVSGTLVETEAGVEFDVSDGEATIHVSHVGVPPQLFREGVGAIVEGAWQDDEFHSDSLILKHDENYTAPHDTESSDT